jgi:hypothetical protein
MCQTPLSTVVLLPIERSPAIESSLKEALSHELMIDLKPQHRSRYRGGLASERIASGVKGADDGFRKTVRCMQAVFLAGFILEWQANPPLRE